MTADTETTQNPPHAHSEVLSDLEFGKRTREESLVSRPPVSRRSFLSRSRPTRPTPQTGSATKSAKGGDSSRDSSESRRRIPLTASFLTTWYPTKRASDWLLGHFETLHHGQRRRGKASHGKMKWPEFSMNPGHCFGTSSYWQPVNARLRLPAAGGNGLVVRAVAAVNCSDGLQSAVLVPWVVAMPSTT